jgi:hypothetical protein
MKLKLIAIAALMLSMVGLAGCFDEDYGPYGHYPGYYGYGYGPAYGYGGWWGDGDWDDSPHYQHWDGDDWGHGWRHGHWDRDEWLGAGHGLRFNQARAARGPILARNELRGFGGGFHRAPAFAGGNSFRGGASGFRGGHVGGHRR